MEIKIVDNFLSQKDFFNVSDFCKKATFNYGETDNPDTPPTGMVHNIVESSFIFNIFKRKTDAIVKDDLTLDKMYINCFAPCENPYYHFDSSDSKCITFLYYANKEWKLNDGGETQFFIDEEIKGVVPKPNRMVYFNSSIFHKATSFRDKHRFTVAIKYIRKNIFINYNN